MHICFISNEYPKSDFAHGGVGTFIHTISHELTKRGHDVSIVGINVYTLEDETQKDGDVSVFRLRPKILKGLTWYLNTNSINKKLRELHLKNPIDIVETAELGLAFMNKIESIRYIIRLHGGHHFFSESENRKVSWWKGYQEKRSFKKADAFIAVSKYVKAHTAKYLSYHNKPIQIIRYPINLKVFKPQPKVATQPKALVFAGTVCEKKGVAYLVRAMSKVLIKHQDVDLYIYGRDWYFKNGRSYIDYLKKDVLPELGEVTKHIHFMGSVSYTTLAKKYASAQLCVFPSLMETQGLVAPEAMAMGKLVLFSNIGPGPETIEHKRTGLLCNPYDSDDIAEKIDWALSNQLKCKRIAEEGRKFVMSNFDINLICNDNMKFYSSLFVK